jgi:hypothetical protein
MIRSAEVCALYLFDVSESVELGRLSSLLPQVAQPARLPSKPAIPAYVRYQTPPLQVDAAALGCETVTGYEVRVKIFDYGVVSLALTRPFAGTWDELSTLAYQLAVDNVLDATAERLLHQALARIEPALSQPRASFLTEEYLVFSISQTEPELSADGLIAQAGPAIAQLLRAELKPLSQQEIDEVLRHRLSYLADDLVVATWNGALVRDTPEGAAAALELFEYANSQLLQFRYYDELLDNRLGKIYKELAGNRSWSWLPKRYTRAAREVHAAFIEVTELTDRTKNALKLVGDVYAARLLALAHSRLGVGAWREAVDEKLKTLDEIYRFAVDQTGMSRGHLLELTIVAILVFELILFFMGVMR